jgi:hypothetical protein
VRITATLLTACVFCCLAGCGGTRSPRLTGRVVTARQWKALFNDWYVDGRIDRHYSCAVAVIATSHLPADPPIYSDATQTFEKYTAKVCHPGDLRAVHVGMTDTDVAAVAGAPQLPAYGCWQYPVTRRYAGLRVCFKNGRATLVQQAIHG